MTVHAFYKHREAQGTCKNCGKLIIRDRWQDCGWGHYQTAASTCYPPSPVAEPKE